MTDDSRAYDHASIEKKWQDKWDKDGIYKTAESSDKPKQYILDMFPYPSGEGLHVGHPRGYIATDVYSRKKRMEGYNVLHPMGWDAFGLPAEQYAIETGTHPSIVTTRNINTFRRQIQALGYEGDILLVDSSIKPGEGKIIIAAIDGMLTVKRLGFLKMKPYLLPANPDFDPIPILENSEVHIWGVVIKILRSL